jgi:hypothetical protein
MRPVAEWGEDDLLALIRDEVQESLTLDYKRSAALGKGSTERNSLSKDVSAFANSEGGMIIYGMEENGHVPTAIDVGVDRTQITKEWLESVSKTSIHPTVDRMLIKLVPLPSKGPNAVAYVLEIGAIDERRALDSGAYLLRDRLLIRASDALRSAGSAIVLLEKPLRNKVAELINKIDDFNHKIETVDPGNREKARLNQQLRGELATASSIGAEVSDALRGILEREP